MLLSQWKSKYCHCDQSPLLCKLLDKGEQLLLFFSGRYIDELTAYGIYLINYAGRLFNFEP